MRFFFRQAAVFIVLLACGFLSLATSDCTDFESRATDLEVAFAQGQAEARLGLDFDGDYVVLTVEGLLTVYSRDRALHYDAEASGVAPGGDPMDAPGGMGGSKLGIGGQMSGAAPLPTQTPRGFNQHSCLSEGSRYAHLRSPGVEQTLVCWSLSDGPVVRLVRSDRARRTVHVTGEVFENIDFCNGEYALGISLEQLQ